MNNPNLLFITTGHAAKILSLSVGAIQLLVDNGNLIAWKTQGGHRRILRSSIETYLKSNHPGKNKGNLAILILDKDKDIQNKIQKNFDQFQIVTKFISCSSVFDVIISASKINPDIFIISTNKLSTEECQLLSEFLNQEEKTNTTYIGLDLDNSSLQLINNSIIYATKPFDNWLRGFISGYLQSSAPLTIQKNH
jgi:excisionase family DNA binding protein